VCVWYLGELGRVYLRMMIRVMKFLRGIIKFVGFKARFGPPYFGACGVVGRRGERNFTGGVLKLPPE
jgi:hypothetical protein